MKKLIAAILTLTLALALISGCAKGPQVAMNIGALKGPTGMGVTMLMGEEYADKYSVTLGSAPDEISSRIISGELDVAAVPINLASVLYNKTEGKVSMLAVTTLGVLYILENGEGLNSLSDLSGKTLYATGQGSTPEYILDYLLNNAGLTQSVNVEYKSEHSELATLMSAGEASLGMLPEPNVSAVLLANADVRIALNLTELWEEASGVPPVQGCLIVRNEYLEANKAAIEALSKDYAASVEYVLANQEEASALMETYGVVPKAAVAAKALPNSNIVCVSSDEMKEITVAMLDVLFNANPKSVGGAMPGDDFYYGAQ